MLLDVVFNLNTFWRWNDDDATFQNPKPFLVEYLITVPEEEGAQH